MNIITKEKIKTERLELRPFVEANENRLVYLLTNDEITKTFMVPTYETEEEYHELAQKLIAFSQPNDTKHFEYGVFLDDTLIGFVNDCGFNDFEIEIGYVMDPAYKGKGYTTEAVKALIPFLFQMGFKKISAGFFLGNEGSKRVIEKVGMHPSGIIEDEEYRGQIHKCIYYEIENND